MMAIRHTLPFPVLLLALFLAATLSIAQTVEPISSTTNLTETEIICTKPRLFKLRPQFGDCVKAIKKLSDSKTEGRFHYGGNTDILQLPLTENYRSCDVIVELGYNRARDASSWYHVKKRRASHRYQLLEVSTVVGTNRREGSDWGP